MRIQASAGVVPMNQDCFKQRKDTAVYWISGGGAMINTRGIIILLDPALIGFDMPLLCESPIHPADIPHVDAVLITHCDNDHFSRDTLKELKDKCDEFHSTHYVSTLFEQLGIEAQGHDINETFEVKGVKISLTPAWHNWQNGSPKHSKERYFAMEDYCGFYIECPDGTIWMPGDSRLMEEQLKLKEPDVILMDISDGSWHIGLNGVKKLTETYRHSTLIPIHWGCVRSEWKEFNGNPFQLDDVVYDLSRMKVLRLGEEHILHEV